MTRKSLLFILLLLPCFTAHAQGNAKLSYDSSCVPTAVKADGSALSTVGTTTGGIQEVITYGESVRVPIVIDGCGSAVVTTSTVTIGSTLAQSYQLRGLSVRATGIGPAIRFDSPLFVGFEWTGSLQCEVTSSDMCVLFKPVNTAPGEFAAFSGLPIMKFGTVRMPFAWKKTGSAKWMYAFDVTGATGAAIVDMRFVFDGMVGQNIMETGISMLNPPALSPPTNSIAENRIDFGFVGGMTVVGIQEGGGTLNHQTQPMNTNHWIGAINADQNMVAYFATSAEDGIYDIRSMSINAGTVQWGMIFNVGSRGGTARMPQIQATNSVYFGGTKSKVYAPNTGTSGPPTGAGANGNELIQ